VRQRQLPVAQIVAVLCLLLTTPLVVSASMVLDLSASASLGCQIVHNQGVDSIAEYRDETGQIIRYAGTWRGREGSYLLLPDARATSLQLRPLEADALDDQVSITACPPDMPQVAAQALTDAVDLKLQRYFGQAVNSEQIEQQLETAIAGFGQANMPIWLASARNELAEHYLSLGQLDAALQQYRLLLQHHQRQSDQPGIAATENMLGLTHWRLGQLDQADEHYRNAVQLREQLQDQRYLAALANNLGLLAAQRGDNAEALRQYELALTVNQGDIDLRAAITAEQAPALLRLQQINNLSSALNTLGNLALLLDGSGQPVLAERYWRNVLAFDGQVDEQRVVEQSRRNLAQMLQRQGRLDEALLLLTQALDYFETIDSSLWQAETLLNLSRLYALLGDQQAAGQHLALAVALNVDDANTRGKVLLNQAKFQRQQGSFDQAKADYELAASQYQQADMRVETLSVRAELAYLQLLQGATGQALAELQATQQQLADLNAQPEAAITLSRYGQAQLIAGDLGAARQSLQQALKQLDHAGDVLAKLEFGSAASATSGRVSRRPAFAVRSPGDGIAGR
jgi:tetratricopeptide (TPR) repeat protein